MEEELIQKVAVTMANMALNIKALREDLNIRLLRAEARIKELITTTELQAREIEKLKGGGSEN